MRIKSDKELLDIKVRKQIIDEILGSENQKRKDEAYRRYLSFKDNTDRFVVKNLLEMFDQSTVNQMTYAISNVSLIRKTINKLARVYSNGVERSIIGDTEDTQKIHDLSSLMDFDTAMKMANSYLKLQRNTVCYVNPCKYLDKDGYEKYYPKLMILSPHLYDAVEDYYDKRKAVAYILSNYELKNTTRVSIEPAKEGRVINTPQPTSRGDSIDQKIADTKEDEDIDLRQFIFWSDNYHFTCNVKGEIVNENGVPSVIVDEEQILNPIDEKPFINFAIDQDNSFWATGGKDLVDGGILVNSMLTNLNHISVIQGYGQFYMKGKNLPRSVLLGPDKAILLEYTEDDPVPDIGYLTANPPLSEIRQNVEMYVALILSTNNLSTSGVSTQLNSSGNVASGIALIIDKSESQEDVKDQQQVFKDQEPNIWRVISKWINLYDSEGSLDDGYSGLGLKDNFEDEFVVRFNDPQTIISESERLSNLEKRKNLGINTMIELIKKDQPDLDDEQAKAKLIELQEEKLKRMASFSVPKSSDKQDSIDDNINDGASDANKGEEIQDNEK